MVYFKVTAKNKQINVKHDLKLNPRKKKISQRIKIFGHKIGNFFKDAKRKCLNWKRRNF